MLFKQCPKSVYVETPSILTVPSTDIAQHVRVCLMMTCLQYVDRTHQAHKHNKNVYIKIHMNEHEPIYIDTNACRINYNPCTRHRDHIKSKQHHAIRIYNSMLGGLAAEAAAFELIADQSFDVE
jgi:hypothetical protein